MLRRWLCPQGAERVTRCLLPAMPAPPAQVSARNRWMVQSDWLRTKLFGRNITEI